MTNAIIRVNHAVALLPYANHAQLRYCVSMIIKPNHVPVRLSIMMLVKLYASNAHIFVILVWDQQVYAQVVQQTLIGLISLTNQLIYAIV